jgi:hypothetical protein
MLWKIKRPPIRPQKELTNCNSEYFAFFSLLEIKAGRDLIKLNGLVVHSAGVELFLKNIQPIISECDRGGAIFYFRHAKG